MKEMKKNYAEQLAQMQNQIAAMQKELTLVDDKFGDPDQDGNVGSAQELSGNVDYEKQDSMLNKKKMLISKMKAQG